MNQSSHRTVDDNGYLTVLSSPVSSFGIFEYSAAQVGLPGDPNRIVNVYRPEAALSSPDAIKSFQVVPFIDEHDLLSGFEEDGDDVMSPDEKGVDGVMYNVRYLAPWLTADLKVFTRRLQRAIESGKVELSLGYTCDWEFSNGTFNGTPYEVIQTNMYGNHIALVDAARVEGAKVLDSKLKAVAFDCLSFVKPTLKGNADMIKNGKKRSPAMDNAIEQLKGLIPALEQFFKEEGTEPEHQEGAEAGAVPETSEAAPAEAGVEEGAEAGDEDVGALVGQIKTLLDKLAAGGSGAEASVADEGEEGEGMDEGDEGEAEDAEGQFAGTEEGEHTPGVTVDDIDGIDGTAQDCENNGGASQGPASGKNAVGDAALRKSIYKDMADKQKLYDRVSPVIGVFDHSLMSCEEMAAYAAKKLKLDAPKGRAGVALDGYLKGYERKEAVKKQSAAVGDSAFGDLDVIDQYLNK